MTPHRAGTSPLQYSWGLAQNRPSYMLCGQAGLFLEAEVGHWAAVCSVNYLGVVHTLKAGVPAMVARGGGRVVVINSTGGFMGAAQNPWSLGV